MSGYIGNIPTPQATQTRDVFTATAGQTSFATSGYTPGFLDVYLNGVHLVNGTDYTASNGSDVVLSSGATAGDNVEVVAYTTFQVVDQSFSGNFSVDSPTFVVDAANNRVGVGTSSPRSTLDVSGVATVGSGSPPELNLYRNVLLAISSAAGWVNFGGRFDGSTYATGASVRGLTAGQWSSTSYATNLTFHTTAVGSTSLTERMRIASNGDIYIGQTSADFGAATDGFYITNLASSTTPIVQLYKANTANQRVIEFRTPFGVAGSINTNGTSTIYNTSSDYRLKENVVPLAGAADRLAQIPVHRFNFIAVPDTTVDGFLAHEVQEFVPECVTGTKDEVDDEGNPVYQGIDQSKLVPLLTAALQEALADIATLKAEVAALKGEPA